MACYAESVGRCVQKKSVSIAPRTAVRRAEKIETHASAPLPKPLRRNVEALGGFSFAAVRVHHDSPEPAMLRALAFTRGSDIHLGPGQEQHLPHEAWHVVQQKQGRVQPTALLGGVPINSESSLESEADQMASRVVAGPAAEQTARADNLAPNPLVVQRQPVRCEEDDGSATPAPLGPSQACLDLIKQFEGCEKKRADGDFDAYPDPATGADPWTIGWGSTGSDIVEGLVWTQQQCDDRLASDVKTFASSVTTAIGDAQTSQNQFDALTSFAYNAGASALAGSTLLKKHKAGKYDEAAKQFGQWVNAGGKKMKGLVTRRAAEAKLYSD